MFSVPSTSYIKISKAILWVQQEVKGMNNNKIEYFSKQFF
jgi:hypothetical protein